MATLTHAAIVMVSALLLAGVVLAFSRDDERAHRRLVARIRRRLDAASTSPKDWRS